MITEWKQSKDGVWYRLDADQGVDVANVVEMGERGFEVLLPRNPGDYHWHRASRHLTAEEAMAAADARLREWGLL